MAVVSRSHRALKRKYRQVRQEFKKDIFEVAKNNRAFAMMIILGIRCIIARFLFQVN